MRTRNLRAASLLLLLLIILSLFRGAGALADRELEWQGDLHYSRGLAFYAEGYRLELVGDFTTALEAYMAAVRLLPHEARIYRRIVNCYLSEDRIGDNIAYFESLREHFADLDPIHRWLGFLYQLEQSPELARERYSRAIELNPHCVDAYVELAILFFSVGDRHAAIDLLKKSLPNVDDHVRILDLTGRIYLDLLAANRGSADLAEKCLDLTEMIEEYIAAAPAPLTRIAYIYTAGRRLERALETYGKIIEIDPRYSDAYRGIAEIFIAQGRIPDALKILGEGERKAARPYEIMAMLAGVHSHAAERELDLTEAIDHRDQAISLLERIPGAEDDRTLVQRRLALIQLYAANEDFAHTLDLLRELEQDFGVMPTVRASAEKYIVSSIQKEPSTQIVRLAEVAKQFDGDSGLLSFIADIMIRVGDLERAHALFTRALQAGNLPTGGLYARAALAAQALDKAGFFEMLDAGAELFPKSLEILEARGRLQMQSRDYVDALETFLQAKAVFDETTGFQPSVLFRLYLAALLQKNSRSNEAFETLNNPEMLSLPVLEGYYELTTRHFEGAELAEFTSMLEQLARENPAASELFAFVGRHYSRQEEHRKASVNYRRAIELAAGRSDYDPTLLALYNFWNGASLERLGDIAGAEQYLRACIALDKSFAEAYNYLAYTWAEANVNLAEAREFIDAALEIDPDNGAFIDTLGWILYRKGQYEESLEYLMKANELMPDHKVVLEHIGDAYKKLGDCEKARQYYEKSSKAIAGD